MSDKKWLQKYVFTYFHEIFFGEFPIILTEWLERLVEKMRRFNTAMPRNWTPKLVRQMNCVSNPTAQAIDFWLDSVLGGYFTEFAYIVFNHTMSKKGIFSKVFMGGC
jgi:hypothetical protein